jgi:hypothetical protein
MAGSELHGDKFHYSSPVTSADYCGKKNVMTHSIGTSTLVMPSKSRRASLEEQLETDLLALYGPLIGGKDLQRVLGYRTAGAFRQAAARKKLPVDVFTIPNRKGRFCLAKDLARWLAATSQTAPHGVEVHGHT